MKKKEEIKITKRESIKYGSLEIKCTDIVNTAQKDGNANGFAVGMVCGEVKEGKRTRFTLVPLSEIIKDKGTLVCAEFNAYTKRFTTEESAAKAVKNFAERFAVSVGDRASKINTNDKKEKKEIIKRSPFERIVAILDKIENIEDKHKVIDQLVAWITEK